MNTPDKTWQERAEIYLKMKENPLSDINQMNKIKEGLEWVNTIGISQDERELLNRVFN